MTYEHKFKDIYLFSKTSTRRPGVAITTLMIIIVLNNLPKDSHINSHSHPHPLVFSRSATNDRHRSHAQFVPKFMCFNFNLLCQFSCGRQNDRIGALFIITGIFDRNICWLLFWDGCDPNEQWNQKCGCFSWSSFSNTNNVPILQTNWDCLSLDRGRLLNSNSYLKFHKPGMNCLRMIENILLTHLE